MLFGVYGLFINFSPSEEVFSFSQKYSFYVGVALSVPLLFYKGFRENVPAIGKVLCVILLSLLIWGVCFLNIAFFIPSQIVKLTGDQHKAIVRVYDKNKSFKR